MSGPRADVVARPRFDTGRDCLNLLATVGLRGADPVERVPDEAALAAWLVAAGLLDAPPVVHAKHLAAMRSLRTATWDVLAALRAGRPVPDDALVLINTDAAHSTPIPRLTADGRGVRESAHPVESALAALARDLIDLVTGPDLDRVSECTDSHCRMLFVDTSRGGRRRWCSMTRCGNRAKVRAHTARNRRRARA
ncbi:CGNR zinc finger domain-containing protein [Amycolatopsis palatopharyngis]|uniref:CGNR zinc finger domain-containing protein n=1 Tax=Amycolatopsis palatopharyngis TaxID=187982 RepID=UPI000E222589|nr:ABATE domain-containing protein [Amycolatopsis palatopharyngis]